MVAHILIVEDDPFLTKMLAFLLADAGYQTTALADPRRVAAFLDETPVDLALLDVMLPHIDGLALCAAIRRAHPDTPIVFLSARGMVADKVGGFGHGADDYLAKPFEPTELLARIQAVLRRYRPAGRNVHGTTIRAGDMALEIAELRFTAPGRRSAVLTPTEMKLLECLMRNANTVLSREALIARTWGYECDGGSNQVEVYIRRLRRKIETDAEKPVLIDTVRGVGYRFRASA